ncbi:MAG: WbqC family protein [Bacteroidetes bacterium]|nr:WbqC family protein [Bacteroidota bacterium]
MKIGIMQPYFFPYIGYFQLIEAVDEFVFYDDVQFINNGWINRNRILINKEAKMVTVPLANASYKKLINEIPLLPKTKYKILTSIELAYKKAPNFETVFPLISEVIATDYKMISELSTASVMCVSQYLDLKTRFHISSQSFANSAQLKKENRLYDICAQTKATTYINTIGGKSLYNKQDFANRNIQLYFTEPNAINYKQWGNNFIPWLSIIDVMMFNTKAEIKQMLSNYKIT